MAVGHNVGVSALSGGAVRYRAYTALGLPVARVAAVIACYPIAYALGAATLLGLTLVLAPGTAPGGERLGEPILRLVGLALCAAPLVWLWLARRAVRPFALGRLRLAPPASPLALAQVGIGTADVLVTAAMPWLLLSTQAEVGFAPFLGAYVVAVTLGAASGVPGGLGVVEGAFVALLPDVAPAALVGALLAWRVLYFLVPLALALVVLGGQLLADRLRARRQVIASSPVRPRTFVSDPGAVTGGRPRWPAPRAGRARPDRRTGSDRARPVRVPHRPGDRSSPDGRLGVGHRHGGRCELATAEVPDGRGEGDARAVHLEPALPDRRVAPPSHGGARNAGVGRCARGAAVAGRDEQGSSCPRARRPEGGACICTKPPPRVTSPAKTRPSSVASIRPRLLPPMTVSFWAKPRGRRLGRSRTGRCSRRARSFRSLRQRGARRSRLYRARIDSAARIRSDRDLGYPSPVDTFARCARPDRAGAGREVPE